VFGADDEKTVRRRAPGGDSFVRTTFSSDSMRMTIFFCGAVVNWVRSVDGGARRRILNRSLGIICACPRACVVIW
jgi:hypothetical protein